MKHMWSVFNYEIRRNFMRKGFLFATFGLPLVGFMIMMGIQAFAGSPEDQLAELDFDYKGIEAAGYVDLSGEFPEPGEFAADVLTLYVDEEAAQAALEAGEIEVFYIIAEDYLETGEVLLVAPNFSIVPIMNGSVLIESLMYSQWIDEVELNILLRLRQPSFIEEVEFAQSEDGEVHDEGADFAILYGFSLIFLIALSATNGYLMQSVIEEKESRLIEILISSVRPSQLLSGKILAFAVLGIFQVCMFIVTGIILAHLAAGTSSLADTAVGNLVIPYEKLPLLLTYFVLGYLFFAAGFGAVGALANSISEGPNLTLIFVIPAIIPFYFMSLFLQDPNSTIPVLFSLFPITAPIAMTMRLSITSVPLLEIAISIILLVIVDLGMLWLAGRLFRMQTLLSGKAPKLRDIPKLIRG